MHLSLEKDQDGLGAVNQQSQRGLGMELGCEQKELSTLK